MPLKPDPHYSFKSKNEGFPIANFGEKEEQEEIKTITIPLEVLENIEEQLVYQRNYSIALLNKIKTLKGVNNV